MSSDEEDDDKSHHEEKEKEESEESEENINKNKNKQNNKTNKISSQQNKIPSLIGSSSSKVYSTQNEPNNPVKITLNNKIHSPIDNRPPEEIEKEQLLQSNNQLELENKKLTQKIAKLKQSIIEMKSRLGNEIMQELSIQQEKINDLNKALNESNQTIIYLQSQLKKKIQHQTDISLYNKRYEATLIEKKENEELIARQDEEIKKYSLYNTKSSNAIMNGVNKIKNYEQNIKVLKTFIFESEETIKKIKERIEKKTQEEQNRNQLINDKNKEIEMLLSFINSHQTQITLNKQNEQNLQKQIRIIKKESKKLTTVLNDQTLPKQNKSIINNNNNYNLILNDNKPMLNYLQDESNLKEISGLMQQVLEE